MDILDTHIEEARKRAANNEATDADWMLLILARQCGQLAAIRDAVEDVQCKVAVFWSDRKRALAVLGSVGLGGAGIGGAVIALLERL